MEEKSKEYVFIRRQWNDYRIGQVPLNKIWGLHWGWISGGVQAPTPQLFIHGYVICTDVEGEIAHSGVHGECPHNIKICIVKKDNKEIWNKLLKIAGPKPQDPLERIISGHAPGHLREEVLELLEVLNIWTMKDKKKTKRLYNLLGKLWNCTDIMPSSDIKTTNEFLEEELSQGSTYGMVARRLRPILKDLLNERR